MTAGTQVALCCLPGPACEIKHELTRGYLHAQFWQLARVQAWAAVLIGVI